MELARLPKIKVSNMPQYAPSDDLEAPIIGYETREPCNRHTVYKIYVQCAESRGWFVHRRYREFHKLKADLAKLFPAKEFSMPSKRYFGDNFEPRFLSGRRQGLQGFLYMITRQKEVLKSAPVAAFLALDSPPSAKDDPEQCQAVIRQLQAAVAKLETDCDDHDTHLAAANGQIAGLHDQKHAVMAALRYERQQSGRKPYPGDDLSLMFEYRALPEVCRVDMSSFLIRKPSAFTLASRKLFDAERTRKEDARSAREHDGGHARNAREHEGHATSRAWNRTPPIFEHGRYGYDVYKTDRGKRDATARNSKPHVEVQPPPRSRDGKRQFPSTENVSGDCAKAGAASEFQSFHDFQRRRKSMPGAVEIHTMQKACAQPIKNDTSSPRATSLTVPYHGNRPRSYSAQQVGEYNMLTSQNLQQACLDRMKRQMTLDGPKKGLGWCSLKDLNKLKGKI